MQPHAIITPLKAIRMLLNGSAVLVRAERWEEITRPARKSRWAEQHATCQETITRQREEIERLSVMVDELKRALAGLLRSASEDGLCWCPADWPILADHMAACQQAQRATRQQD